MRSFFALISLENRAETHSCLLGAKGGFEVILNVLIQVYPISWELRFGKVPHFATPWRRLGRSKLLVQYSTREFHVNWIDEGSGARSKRRPSSARWAKTSVSCQEHFIAEAGGLPWARTVSKTGRLNGRVPLDSAIAVILPGAK